MEVEFDDPTEHIPTVKFPGYYTVIIRERFDLVTHHYVLSLKEVHDIIKTTKDYRFHKQILKDPYTYIIITTEFYINVCGESLF